MDTPIDDQWLPTGELYICTEYANHSKGYWICQPDYIKFEETVFNRVEDVFPFHLGAEAGRCFSKIYRDEGEHVGWAFEKREKYTDADQTYLLHTFVTFATRYYSEKAGVSTYGTVSVEEARNYLGE